MGIRPEYLSFKPAKNQEQNSFVCHVLTVEHLGNSMNVHLDSDFSDRFVADVNRNVNVQVGKEIKVYIDLAKAHLFEFNEAGRNLTAVPI